MLYGFAAGMQNYMQGGSGRADFFERLATLDKALVVVPEGGDYGHLQNARHRMGRSSPTSSTVEAMGGGAFDEWIGRSVDAVDLVTAAPIVRLAATLGHDGAHWPTGLLPPLGHWLFHLPTHRVRRSGATGIRRSAGSCHRWAMRGECGLGGGCVS